MRKSAILAAGFALFALVAARADQAPAIAGQSAPPTAAKIAPEVTVVPPGEYKRLNIWAKLQLGSAVFTNPQVVRNAKFAYSFNPDDFQNPEVKEKILGLAKEGKIGFGIPGKADGSVKVMSLATLGQFSHKGTIDSASELSAVLADVGGQVVAERERLLGSKAADSLIKSPDPSSSGVPGNAPRSDHPPGP